jgi:hypothetical protein
MSEKYICYHVSNFGKVCNRGCRRPEGCFEHWRCKKRVPCEVCGKPTASASKRCKKHAGDYYLKQYYIRLLSKQS